MRPRQRKDRHHLGRACLTMPKLAIAISVVCCAITNSPIVPAQVAKSVSSRLPYEGRMPSLNGLKWSGSSGVTDQDLKGKVVLIDFWTYSCINCIRVTPYLNAWAAKYRSAGLAVIGVHTPEFGFEKRPENIQEAVNRFHIQYPVLIDSDYKLWDAFSNQFWPAYYLVDGKGNIRYHQFGEGDYDKAEKAIQALLLEVRGANVSSALVSPSASGAQAPPSAGAVGSPETYLGYSQATNFASPHSVKKDTEATYRSTLLRVNQWSLSGSWTISADNATLDQANGSVSFRFQARDLNLVMAPSESGAPIRFRVLIDGHKPDADHGADIDSDGKGVVDSPRLYQLVRQKSLGADHTVEIDFETAGAKVFVFTFG